MRQRFAAEAAPTPYAMASEFLYIWGRTLVTGVTPRAIALGLHTICEYAFEVHQ